MPPDVVVGSSHIRAASLGFYTSSLPLPLLLVHSKVHAISDLAAHHVHACHVALGGLAKAEDVALANI